MQIRLDLVTNGTAAAQSQYAALTKTVTGFNAALARTTATAAGLAAANAAIPSARKAFTESINANQLMHAQQVRYKDSIEETVKALQKQKLGMREVFGRKNRQLMKSVYRDQLAMQSAIASFEPGVSPRGGGKAIVATGAVFSHELDGINNKLGFFGHQLASASNQLVNWGKNTQWAGRQLMAGLTYPIAAFGAAAGVMAYQVDKELTRIQKVYDTTADVNSKNLQEQAAAEKELMQLREDASQTAVKAAKAYGSAATETLQVQADLAATGQTGVRLQESTNEVMRISMLGEIDHAVATEALISVQAILGATTKETADAFNYMNAIENATSLATADFAAAIPRALGPMKEMSAEGSSAAEVLQNMSILMVAMKERGIDAGEGANAIKAMMQRLYRPSQKVREEWEAMVGIDPQQLVDAAGGDIMKILPQISAAVKDLNQQDKIKALAGLFGTYQVTRMSAMLDGIDKMNQGIGQTATVLKVNQQSWKDWAQTAENEQKRAAESASGQFKRALETIKVELALIGEPFLEVATFLLKMTTSVLGFFNALPEGAKKAAIIAAMLVAVVGPAIMLVGLFANLAGNAGRMVAALIKGAAGMDLFTRSQWLQKRATELSAASMSTSAGRAEILRASLAAVTEATNASTAAFIANQRAAMGLTLPKQAFLGMPGMGPTRAGVNAATNTNVRTGTPINMVHPARPEREYTNYHGTRQETQASKDRRAEAQRLYRLESERNTVLAAQSREMTAQRNTAAAQANISERMNRSVAGAAAGSAAMAASMILMMGTSNETANNIGMWLMIGTLVVPAVASIASLMKMTIIPAIVKAAGAAKLWAIAQWNAARATAASAGGIGAASKVAAGGLLRSTMGILSGWGGIALAATAVVAGVYMWNQHQKKILEQQIQMKKNLADISDELIQTRDNAGQGYGMALQIDELNVDRTAFADSYNEAKEYWTNESRKDSLSDWMDLSPGDFDKRAMTEYTRLVAEAGMKAEEAQAYIAALYAEGSGVTANEAINKAQQIQSALGNISIDNPDSFVEALRNELKIAEDEAKAGSGRITDATIAGIRSRGENMGNFLSGVMTNGTAAQIESAMDDIQTAAMVRWQNMFEAMKSDDELTSLLNENDIKNAQELSNWFRTIGGEAGAMREIQDATSLSQSNAQMFVTGLSEAGRVEKEIIGSISANNDFLDDRVKTYQQLTQDAAIYARTATFGEALANFQAQNDELNDMKNNAYSFDHSVENIGKGTDNLFGTLAGINRQTADAKENSLLTAINTYNAANGFAQAETVAGALRNLTKKVASDTETSAQQAERLGNALNNVPSGISVQFDTEDVAKIAQESMSGVQDAIANSASQGLEERMQAALDKNESYWDDRIANAEDAAERETKAFEDNWERRKKQAEATADARIESVEKQIDAERKAEQVRQQIFEAEKTRIQRLAEIANSNIDFNVALRTGDLDEAARLSNDANARTEEWAFDDAANRASSASEARTEALEKRKEDLEAFKDAQMDALSQLEDQEKDSLDRRQKMNADKLKADAEADKKALRASWNREKSAFDQRIALFKSYIARDQADLERWMQEVGISYDSFGSDVKSKGQDWSQYFRKTLAEQVRLSGTQIASDKMWGELGESTTHSMLKGMGFVNMEQLQEFMRSGKMPSTFGKNINTQNSGTRSGSNGNGAGLGMQVRHEGGWIGTGGGNSRKGVAKNVKGVHPSEQMVLARKGEYMVDAKTAKNHGSLLENLGGVNTSRLNTGDGVGGATSPGIAGAMAAVVSRMFASGLSNAMSQRLTQTIKSRGAASGVDSNFVGQAGSFGGREFNADQMKNAATIARVGKSMGMSPRDIQIGIMTAIAESGLVNVNYGDRDSLGLFQQRPSMGWGTPDQVRNPEYASKKFFDALKRLSGRDSWAPWKAAQAVQRSAFADGSNYQKWWESAQMIYNRGLQAPEGIQSKGGWAKPSVPGKGWSNIHDYRNGLNSPLYAHSDGVVVDSRAVTSGGSAGNGLYGGKYRSYGETIAIRGLDGKVLRYAHLAPGARYVKKGDAVRAGQPVGLSGNTGNSTGPHTHFDIDGNYDALGYFKKRGISLDVGAFIGADGLANIHEGEAVVDPGRTADLRRNLDTFNTNVASGGNVTYDIDIDARGNETDPKQIVNMVITAIRREDARKAPKRT